ncbi:LysR substrate-binding domain-containing protein [Aquabacterium sp.]|uniref:LysR substrate-binding domain-containing protein n=1 Tax=Aquabacterium sp. TaxID=1872578 RepID=UPI002C1C549F|nr:LysR substrate-binding domain-containing protein [Aquabacterium sp.]HSW04025.1 LysR substrate-binding domain-containing protein [Aquabacterium sp.]
MAARPPLNALFVFCEAARCGSFTLAAQALNVTPGAVSRQIRALEDYLALPLFERGPQAVTLTRKGRQLHQRIAPKMAAIQSEAELMRSGGRKAVIRVGAGVTLAMHWLIPRLSRFAEQHPGLQVQVETSDGPIDASRPVDVFIRRDPADLRGLDSQVFLHEVSVLVASPRLVKGKVGLSPRALARLPRIGARSRPDLWSSWSTDHGLDEAAYLPTQEFDNTVLAIQATSEGLGVMVAPLLFIGSLLDSGMLLALETARVATGSYSMAVRARRDTQRVTAFTDWLLQAAND